MNLNDVESWPLPDVFPQHGEYTPLEVFAELLAMTRAYLRPDLHLSELADMQSSSDEVKRKLAWAEGWDPKLDMYLSLPVDMS